MPLLPNKAQYGLEELYLFPVFSSAEDFHRDTGLLIHYDVNKPIKRWFDPSPIGSGSTVTYKKVLSRDEKTNLPVIIDDRPIFEPITMRKTDARIVNIPSIKETTVGKNVWEIECPIRDLFPEEEFFIGFGNVILVRNRNLWFDVDNKSAGFTADDRDLLKSIWSKVQKFY